VQNIIQHPDALLHCHTYAPSNFFTTYRLVSVRYVFSELREKQPSLSVSLTVGKTTVSSARLSGEWNEESIDCNRVAR